MSEEGLKESLYLVLFLGSHTLMIHGVSESSYQEILRPCLRTSTDPLSIAKPFARRLNDGAGYWVQEKLRPGPGSSTFDHF